MQKLNRLRHKLLRTKLVLRCNLEIIKGYELHCNELQWLDAFTACAFIEQDLEDISSSLRYSQEITGNLLEYASETATLVSLDSYVLCTCC